MKIDSSYTIIDTISMISLILIMLYYYYTNDSLLMLIVMKVEAKYKCLLYLAST